MSSISFADHGNACPVYIKINIFANMVPQWLSGFSLWLGFNSIHFIVLVLGLLFKTCRAARVWSAGKTTLLVQSYAHLPNLPDSVVFLFCFFLNSLLCKERNTHFDTSVVQMKLTSVLIADLRSFKFALPCSLAYCSLCVWGNTALHVLVSLLQHTWFKWSAPW